MTLKRVQMLLEPKQHRKLVEFAHAQGKSVAEITRLAIDIGLEKLSDQEKRERMQAVLGAMRALRDSQPRLNIEIVADLHQMRAERDNELASRY